MELIGVALLFTGLAVLAAVPLVALLHSADLVANRRARRMNSAAS